MVFVCAIFYQFITVFTVKEHKFWFVLKTREPNMGYNMGIIIVVSLFKYHFSLNLTQILLRLLQTKFRLEDLQCN